MLEAINQAIYMPLIERYEKFIRYREIVGKKMRRKIVERATISILEDMERMS